MDWYSIFFDQMLVHFYLILFGNSIKIYYICTHKEKVMTEKEELIHFLETKGKGDLTWLKLAERFGIKPDHTPEQRAKAANDIYRRHKNKTDLVNTLPARLEHLYRDTYHTPKLIENPQTDFEEFLNWKQEKNKQKNQVGLHIVVGCMHLPAVNDKLFSAFINFLRDNRNKIKGLHLIGDILDCKSLSQHDLGSVSDITLDDEYARANGYLDVIDSVIPSNIEKNYLWGNHEERYTRLLKKVDFSKFGGALLSPTKACFFEERGYTVQEDYKNASIQLGKHLDLVHGEYVTTNSAKKHLDVYKKSIMFAHTHKMGAHFDSDKAAFNIGWFGNSEDSAFSYASKVTKSQWQNGFAVVNIDEDGFYHTTLIQWYNDRFYYGGKEYK